MLGQLKSLFFETSFLEFGSHRHIEHIARLKMLSRLRIRPVTVRAAGKRFMSGDVESARVEHHRWYQITLGK